MLHFLFGINICYNTIVKIQEKYDEKDNADYYDDSFEYECCS